MTERMSREVDYDVLIVGAGISGIGMGIELRRRGYDGFLIVERARDLGGTWRDNIYPGVAVDIPSVSYCFSFETGYPWSGRFAPGGEILEYVRHCADKYRVAPHIRYDACVVESRFAHDGDSWVTTLEDGTVLTSRFLVVATGVFGEPKLPDIPGLDRFAGRMMHSARWDRDADLTGERVAVIGTGASAVQLVPTIAPLVSRLTVFQRTPIWVAPRGESRRGSSAAEPGRHSRAIRRVLRALSEAQIELLTYLIVNYGAMRPVIRLVERIIRRWMRKQLHDPTTAAALLPPYGLGCKRPATSDQYLDTFNREPVSLVSRPISHMCAEGIVTDDGVLHAVDTIVLATGFLTTERGAVPAFSLIGRDGVELGTWWDLHRRQAYAGVSVKGFPNLFLTAGPYSGGFNWFAMLEANLAHVMACISEARGRDATRVEIAGAAHDRYMEDIWQRTRRTVFLHGSCAGSNSYYVDHRGDASLPLPGTPRWRAARARHVGTSEYLFDGGSQPRGTASAGAREDA